MRLTYGGSNETRELASGEGAQDRHDAIVSRDGMESQRERRHPETTGGDPAATQVADDDAETRHTVQLAEEPHHVVIAKVMKELRADDDVDTAVGEGK